MAESPLSIGYPEISAMVARVGLNYSDQSGDWSAQQTRDINQAVDKGYSDFLKVYDWSFLQQFATITTTEPYDTGTIELVDTDATVTLTTGTWPAWAAQGTLYYDGTEYPVASRTGDDEIELASAYSGDGGAGLEYELRRVYYDLPDNFGQPKTWFTYSSEQHRRPLDRISPADLSAMRAGETTTTHPYAAAIRPKECDGTAGHRWEVGFYPLADAAYSLGYGYYILSETKMRSADPATPYPIGGQNHGQAIMDCCIAAARYLFRDMGLDEYKKSIMIACEDSIRKDKMLGPRRLGFNRDRSDGARTYWSRDGEDRIVTVDGMTPDF